MSATVTPEHLQAAIAASDGQVWVDFDGQVDAGWPGHRPERSDLVVDHAGIFEWIHQADGDINVVAQALTVSLDLL